MEDPEGLIHTFFCLFYPERPLEALKTPEGFFKGSVTSLTVHSVIILDKKGTCPPKKVLYKFFYKFIAACSEEMKKKEELFAIKD